MGRETKVKKDRAGINQPITKLAKYLYYYLYTCIIVSLVHGRGTPVKISDQACRVSHHNKKQPAV